MTTTDPDYLALLRGVLESPLSDMPRIVLCDWLDEPERTGSVPCNACSSVNPGHVYSYSNADSNWWPCPTCNGTGYVSNGNAERAELIRGMCWMTANHTDCPTRMTDYARSRPAPMRCGACEYCATRRRCEKIYSKVQWISGMNYAVCFDPTALDGMMPTGPGITIGVSRGFVGSIRLSAEQFMQHAAELFREHPITEVVLSNVSPAFWQASNTSHYKDDYFFVIGLTITFGDHWHTNNNDRHIIDSEIWEALDGHTIDNSPRVNAKRYPTRELALAALSDACVRYGRRLAGLPEEYQQ